MRRIGLSLLAILLLALAVTPVWAHGVRRPPLPIEPVGEARRDRRGLHRSSLARRTPRRGSSGTRAGLRVGPQSPGPAEVAGVLIATLGLAGLGRSWRRDRRMAVATVTAALALGFVVETTPHLVHHVLDPDKGAGCEALQTAERSQAAVGAVDATPAPAAALLIDPPSDRARSDALRACLAWARPSGLGRLLLPRTLRAPTTRGRAAVSTLPRSASPEESGT